MLDPRTIWSQTQSILAWAPAWLAGILILVAAAVAALLAAPHSGLNRTMVLQNHAVFGTVNANRAHYRAAADALAKADRDCLTGLISRRVPLEHWHEALERRPDDIKVVVEFA